MHGNEQAPPVFWLLAIHKKLKAHRELAHLDHLRLHLRGAGRAYFGEVIIPEPLLCLNGISLGECNHSEGLLYEWRPLGFGKGQMIGKSL